MADFRDLIDPKFYKVISKLKSSIFPNLILLPKYAFKGDGITVCHNSFFKSEQKFNRAYEIAKSTGSFAHDIYWRAHVICWAAKQVSNLEGEFIEFGVNKGGYASLILNYLDKNNFSKRGFYLVDTYCGLDPSLVSKEKSIMV